MNGTSKQPGLIPQAIYMCFDSVADYRDREFLFRVSYLEIYNETVRQSGGGLHLFDPVV
jgi:centromeric protein E